MAGGPIFSHISGGGDPTKPVVRASNIDEHGNYVGAPGSFGITSAPPVITYVPPPTRSQSFLIGWSPQPANPYFFASAYEAYDILNDLRLNCPDLPSNAFIRDAPELYPGPMIYGNDERRVFVVEFEINPKTGPATKFSSPVGQLLWMRATYPNHPWQISFEDKGIKRNPTT